MKIFIKNEWIKKLWSYDYKLPNWNNFIKCKYTFAQLRFLKLKC